MLNTSTASENWNDISRLNKATVQSVVTVTLESDVVDTLQHLEPETHVVVSGTRHSQGGHIVYPNAVVLDMTEFNGVISVSIKNKTIIVQSGITWAQIQKTVNRLGLSIKVMQSSNIFSVGGSLSANVHGRDPGYGPLIESVRSLKIALSSGDVVTTSRQILPDLFYSIIGGYGLIGVILEAEIELTDNVRLTKITNRTDYKDYSKSLVPEIDKMALHYGRCSIVKDETFLRECYSSNFYVADSSPIESSLVAEENVWLNAMFFAFSRSSNFGKSLRWKLQKWFVDVPGKEVSIDRNNAMRPPIEFLKYEDSEDTDILQEYFVPVEKFSTFMFALREELLVSDVNLLSVTLRYLRGNKESILSYSREDMIAIVLYINIGINDKAITKATNWTRNLVALALSNRGSYYLTYQRFPTLEQFQSAYPNWQKFNNVKCKYDPNLIFINKFYEDYFKIAHNKRMRSDNMPATRALCR
jgi:hypothetical protein